MKLLSLGGMETVGTDGLAATLLNTFFAQTNRGDVSERLGEQKITHQVAQTKLDALFHCRRFAACQGD